MRCLPEQDPGLLCHRLRRDSRDIDHWQAGQAGGIPVQLPASQQTPPPQLAVPAQSTVHVFPLHEIGRVQEFAAALSHWMSHDDALQAIGPVHVPAAMHAILHSVPPHAIAPVQEPAPMQSMMHELAAEQSIEEVHEPAPVQVTVHGMPGGQTMGPVQVPAAVHRTAQVPSGSHVPAPASAQTEGHTPAASFACASLASAFDGLPSPASAFDRWPSAQLPASTATPASSLRPFASRTVASALSVAAASSSTMRLPWRSRPQPRASNGRTSSSTGGRVRRSKTA
jgi:hypothetical protein